MRSTRIIILTLSLAAAIVVIAKESALFPVLRSTVFAGKQEGGFFLVPTNQLLRPWGQQMEIPGRPVDAAFDSSKRLLAVLNRRSLHLMDGSTGAQLAEIAAHSTSYAGIAFRPGDRELWASEASRNGPDNILIVALSDVGKPGKTRRIDFNGHPVPAGIAFAPDGKTAYVALSRNNTLGVFNAEDGALLREVNVGVAPFGVVVAAKQGKVFVSNRGGRHARQSDATAPSSGTAVVTDPKTGSSATGTVSVIDLKTFAASEIEVGLAPSGMALSPDGNTLAVASGHSDLVALIDTSTLRRTDLKVPSMPEASLGSQPIAVAFSPDGKLLYVACGGNNGIAVAQNAGKEWKIAGAMPTPWFPSAIAVDAEGGLRVISIKGYGSTANNKGSFNSRENVGLLSKIPRPAPVQLQSGTREVRAANSPQFEPAGGVKNLASLGIQHVFLIVKENRTYDQVFGDIDKGNGDSKLTMFGREVTPNHHALAEKYVLLDNFYTGGAISFDGHHWLMQAFVSDYVERAFAASPRGYAWNMADALTVAPTGFFWQGSRPVSVRIWGEFCLPGRWDPATQNVVDMNESDTSWPAYWKLYKEGKSADAVGCKPGVPALASLHDLRYPYNSTAIPDQLRADAFLRALAEREKSGELPQINILTLNEDHTNGTRPGSPTPRAMVADNDLALGRIVEGISKSRFWSKSLILVVEDDAQDGLDHVDGRRTVAMAIGPHVRRDAVDSNHYNHTSMIRTIQVLFGISARTRYLASARPMTSVFTADADTSAYRCLPSNIALDEMNPVLKGLTGRKLWAAQQSLSMNWSAPDDVPQETLNQILWWDYKGYDAQYPKLSETRITRSSSN